MDRRSFLQTTGIAGAWLLSACGGQPKNVRRNTEAAKFTSRRAVIERAASGIPRYRQGEVTIQVNAPPEAFKFATLKITQTSNSFPLGCYLSFRGLPPERLNAYQEGFSRIFNYATVGGRLQVEPPDNLEEALRLAKPEMDWAMAKEIHMCGNALIDGHKLRQAGAGGQTGWLRKTIQEGMARYKGRISVWNVVCDPLAADGSGGEQLADVIRQALEIARAQDSGAKLVISQSGVMQQKSTRRRPWLELVRTLGAAGAPFDAVGVQAINPRDEWPDPIDVGGVLDEFAALDRRIHISGFAAQANPDVQIAGGYRTGMWDRAKQADCLREFMTLCYGHSHVDAVTLAALDDGRCGVPDGALLADNWQRKPAWNLLERMVSGEWRTISEVRPEVSTHRFHGFTGQYEVTATLGEGLRGSAKFTLHPGQNHEWVLNVERTT
ncbi:MAG: endo-1,4-beta-xylanase [Blastocatellia bacterium]